MDPIPTETSDSQPTEPRRGGWRWSGPATAFLLLVIVLSVVVLAQARRDVLWAPSDRVWIGTVLLPPKDARGLRIGPAHVLAVLPGCRSCSAKNLERGWEAKVARHADLVIVFDREDAVEEHWPDVIRLNKPILFEPMPDGIPLQLSMIAPAMVTLDSGGKVKSYEPL